jgi:hypothetical protein
MTTTTPKLTTLEVNALTGVESVRNLTTEEIEKREIDQAEFNAQVQAAEAKATARASALAKLAELGLTQEEIAAL